MELPNNKNKSQNGGIMITGKPEEAFNFFIKNSNFRYFSRGSGCILFKATLKDDIKSVYKTIKLIDSEYSSLLVNDIIIKCVFVDENYNGKKDTIEFLCQDLLIDPPFFTTSLKRFNDEAIIQTEFFLKTIDYLEPLCPAIVYSDVYKGIKLINFFNIMKTNSIDPKDKTLIDCIYKKYLNNNLTCGIIAMEFIDNYIDLDAVEKGQQTPDNHNTSKSMNITVRDKDKDPYNYMLLYRIMTIFILLKLAYDTGYTHGDFHMGNIFINTNYKNYFKGIDGKPLLIDFGRAQKIPEGILEDIKKDMGAGKYKEALQKLCKIPITDNYGHELDFDDDYYEENFGFVCKYYNIDDLKNEQIILLFKKREEAITEMTTLFNANHTEKSGIFNSLPLTDTVKEYMYPKLIQGGSNENNRKKTRKNRNRSKYSRKKYNRKKSKRSKKYKKKY